MSTEITVCVCIYNAEKYLVDTLDSLAHQTKKDFRLILLDDASTDSSAEIAREWLAAHPQIASDFIQMPENRGIAFCRQRLLEKAGTPFLMFFDSDDIAKPEMVQTLYEKISGDDSLIAVSCYCNYMSANGKVLSGGIYLGPVTKEQFREKAAAGKQMFLLPPTLFRREYALRAGGYRQAEWFPEGRIRYEDMSEDVDLWSRMSDFFAEGKVIVTIPEVLFYYRKNTASLSTGFAKSRAMGQKLMYIKSNLRRRRAGLPEWKFSEFWESVGFWKKFHFERRNLGAYFFRQACFAWVNRRIFRCGGNLALGIVCAPLYPLEKYSANYKKK
ncbi:MAG: glycosyltransferase family 2 protein [Victivallaceae bacterium]|nr:glycosyltransferase family 2 protein [Victivallaceae bacterium]